MADPAIQTFCCIRPNKRVGSAFYAMMEFNSMPYNIVCLVSSFIGILGAAYQILTGNKYRSHKHRWVSLVCLRGSKVIAWLAMADLLASLGVFIRSIVNLNEELVQRLWIDNSASFIPCTIFAAWIQYWYCATWMWTLCYTVDVSLALQDKPGRKICYHLFSWTTPAVLTALSLLYLLYPDGSCPQFSSDNIFIRLLPNYCFAYLPMISVMILNPVLYYNTGKHVRRLVWQNLAQYTNKEREIVDSTYLTFTLINAVFYICWLPNLISTIIIWSLWRDIPVQLIIILWYIMAALNPLQALFNCIVYKHLSKKLNVPWVPIHTEFSESTPLLSTNSQLTET